MNAITANELISGAVVYLYENGDFGVDLQKAKLFGADEQATQDAMIEKTLANPRLVSVEPIVVEVSETGTVWANRLREQIRPTAQLLVTLPARHWKEPIMYRYDEFDAAFVRQRTEQFAHQVKRRLSGELTEEQFRPLRLMNGLYLQLHAYMLRVAVPYGTLNSTQMRKLAYIARTYDRGYGHFTTRQNIQYNWPKLKDVPANIGRVGER